jgi:hypothetical protein
VSDQRDARLTDPTTVETRGFGLLELSVYDLKQIVVAVDRAQQAKLRFDGALHAGRYRVHVRWKSGVDQRDDDELVITRITRA